MTRVRARRNTLTRRIRSLYHGNEQGFALLFFVGGVVWDWSVYDRIDTWTVHLLLLTYLLLLGAFITLSALTRAGRAERPAVQRFHRSYPYGIQFFLGALISAYVVFYFQSASLTQTAFFLVLLIGLLFANEIIHRRLFSLYLLIGLYFFAAFSFFIFLVPVLFRTIHTWTYVVSCLLSLAWIGGMLWLFHRWGIFKRMRQFAGAVGVVVVLFGTLNVFYVQNWMPPVPLSMRYGDVFHHVSREDDGSYLLRYEPSEWYRFWRTSGPELHYVPGEPVYFFAAIFAPAALRTGVQHAWQHYDEVSETWETTDTITYDVVGGRRDGYRGYTFKRSMRPGRWRVDVETENGRVLGRMRFTAVPVEEDVVIPLRERRYE